MQHNPLFADLSEALAEEPASTSTLATTRGSTAAGPPSQPPPPPLISIFKSTVSIVGADGAAVYFTLNGDDPTPAASEYTAPLELGAGKMMVKAVAVRDGVGSTVATAYYAYTPHTLNVAPPSGEYEAQLLVEITSDHDEIRVTLDGTIPTSSSPFYKGPIHVATPGTTVVTAAMFVEGAVIGDVVRQRYTITEARLAPPEIVPPSGTFDAPLRITIVAAGEVRFTLNGEDPSSSSQLYCDPILVETPCTDLVLRAVSVHPTQPRLSSSVVEARFDVVQPPVVDDGRPETLMPLHNIAFPATLEAPARAKAEEVMAWMLASAEFKEKKNVLVEQLRHSISDAKQEYARQHARLLQVRNSIGVANARRSQLEGQRDTYVSAAQQDVDQKLQKAREKNGKLRNQRRALEMQLEETYALHRQSTTERHEGDRARAELKEALHERYLSNKRALHEVDPHLRADAEEMRMVIAEQRHELALLKAAHEIVRNPVAASGVGGEGSAFLPPVASPRRLVDVPVVEAIVPIPVGMMRCVTTVHGGGLQKLREAHSVEACIVDMGTNLAVKVIGHSAGVHRFVEQLQAILHKPPS